MRVPAHDKTLHALSGVCATTAGMAIGLWLRRYGVPVPVSALLACAAVALGREAYNLWRTGRWSWSDIVATMLGSLPALGAFKIGEAA
jgi:hypothetical protein